MMHMHIAMISFHTCPLASLEGKETGGMNVYVLELSKELAKQGNVIDIYTRCQAPDNGIVEIAPRLRLIHLPAGPLGPVPKKKLPELIPEFIQHVAAYMKKQGIRYEVLHCHYYLSGLIGLEIKKLYPSVRLVMSFHTLGLMKNLVARDQLEKEEATRINAEFALTYKVDTIIAPSENDKKYLEYLYTTPNEKIVVIPPGVDTDVFKPMDKTLAKRKIKASIDDKIIMFVGRIEPLKGIDVLLYAVKIMVAKNPQLTLCLWIVGGDISQKSNLWSRPLQSLEDLRKTLQIDTLVQFIGQRPQTELPYYYNSADVVVMPSHYESFGMAALEAMACGVPVITTNVSGVSSLIDERHKALVTSVNNPLLLARQIEHVLTKTQSHTQVGQQLSMKILDFNWSVIAQRVQRVYNQVLSKP